MLKGLKGFERKEIALHMKPGAAPDKVLFTYDDDDQELDMTLLYTDYKACAIVDLPFKGRKECLMWVLYAIKDAVPVHCVEHYDESCEVKIPSYDRDTCSQIPDEL
ncbi:uncharacterized protein LOC119178381 [Rhipicephalus microplus]|uniref:uncharacterized protein LOC119178381 n=1 Tax=Rhipicephalus microplus TaxID=6941 RepID=UPI003F6D7F8A